jgi:HK97 family phage prohead protease
MEYLTVPFETKSIKEDGEFFEFEGYAATFGNIDLGGDKIIKGAFVKTIKEIKSRAVPIDNTNFKRLIPLLWQHRSSEPLGSFVDLEEDKKGLFVKAIMPKGDTFVSGRVMPQMRIKSISKMSIGFRTEVFEMDVNNEVRELKELSLRESSLVTFPMNENAEITDIKAVKIDDISSLQVRELENLLINGVCMSRKDAKTVASHLKNCLYRDDINNKTRRDDVNDQEMLSSIMNQLNQIKL